MTTGTRRIGDFCWTNMLTPQPADARKFFAKLLGWTYTEIPGMGHLVEVGGHGIGAIFDLANPQTPPGTPPHIGVMVKVDDADATCAKVKALGGDAKPAFDIMNQGRMAVCFDPNGAEFDVWQPKKAQLLDADSDQPGMPSWFETLTTDVPRAARFYAELFGWTPGFMATYTTFQLGDTYVAGMMAITPQMGAMRPHWGTYFTVSDADAAERDAKALGASICVPARDIPEVGRFCGITSPQGVTFYAIKYARS